MNLSQQLSAYFSTDKYSRAYKPYASYEIEDEEQKQRLYMTIPLQGSRIELPAFAVCCFGELVVAGSLPDCMAISLYSKACTTGYKSFAKITEVAFINYFKFSRLIKIEGKDADKINTYYATQGALFDSTFHPLMMCTWQLEKKPLFTDNSPDGNPLSDAWFFTCPIMRITPSFYLQKQDNIGRFVLKKVLPALLSKYIDVPIKRSTTNHFGQGWGTHFTPKIEIAECPFPITTTAIPSISTTNATLATTVIQNINDFTAQ